MLIAFENNIFNTDHIATVQLCEGGPGSSLGNPGLYINFVGGTEVSFEGEEARRVWGFLKSASSLTTTEPPDRPWLEGQIEALGQHISETGLTA